MSVMLGSRHAYHDSGAYDRDLAVVANKAARWITERAASAQQAALVLDIDETALSNWEIIKLDDFGRPIAGPCNPGSGAPCGWAAWDQLGRDPPIEPTLQLFRTARAANVAVFFITGRPESQRAATERNLRKAGFGGYTRLYMVPNGAHYASAADFKTPVRREIEGLGLHHHCQYGGPTLRLARWSRREKISPARPVLPSTMMARCA